MQELMKKMVGLMESWLDVWKMAGIVLGFGVRGTLGMVGAGTVDELVEEAVFGLLLCSQEQH